MDNQGIQFGGAEPVDGSEAFPHPLAGGGLPSNTGSNPPGAVPPASSPAGGPPRWPGGKDPFGPPLRIGGQYGMPNGITQLGGQPPAGGITLGPTAGVSAQTAASPVTSIPVTGQSAASSAAAAPSATEKATAAGFMNDRGKLRLVGQSGGQPNAGAVEWWQNLQSQLANERGSQGNVADAGGGTSKPTAAGNPHLSPTGGDPFGPPVRPPTNLPPTNAGGNTAGLDNNHLLNPIDPIDMKHPMPPVHPPTSGGFGVTADGQNLLERMDPNGITAHHGQNGQTAVGGIQFGGGLADAGSNGQAFGSQGSLPSSEILGGGNGGNIHGAY